MKLSNFRSLTRGKTMNPEELKNFLERNRINNEKQEQVSAEVNQLSQDVIKLAKNLTWTIVNSNQYAITYLAEMQPDWEMLVNSCYLNMDIESGYILLSTYDEKLSLRLVNHNAKLTPELFAKYSEYLPDLPIPDLNLQEVLKLQEDIKRAQRRLAELNVPEHLI